MTDQDNRIARLAYNLGGIDTILRQDEGKELAEPLPGVIKQSLEGWQAYSANLLEDLGVDVGERII